MDFNALAQECGVQHNQIILQAIVKTESAFNPFAIGVVGGYLERQPKNKEEAVATALALKARGINYSTGLSQVNQSNFERLGLNHSTAFDACPNLKAGATIYKECLDRAALKFGLGEQATKAALSCYYSGNFMRGQQKEGGYAPSYVEKVVSNVSSDLSGNSTLAIPVVLNRSMKSSTKTKNVESIPGNTVAKESARSSWDVFGDF